MSTIAFSCPGCGKGYEVSSSIAGKKARCKQCGKVTRVPTPTRPATRKASAPPEEDAYGLADSVRPRRGEDKRAELGVSGTPPFRTGAMVDVLRVEECTGDRFRLIDPAVSTLVLVGSGILALVIGFAAFGGILDFFGGRGNRLLLRGGAVVGAIGAIAYGVVAAAWITRIGLQVIVDRRARSLTLRRLYVWDTKWPSTDLRGVVYRVLKPTQDSVGPDQKAEAFVVDASWKVAACLGDTSIRVDHTVPLAEAAIHAARLLDLPIWLDVQGKPSTDSLRRAISLVERCELRSRENLAPGVRRPWISPINVAAALGTALVVGLMVQLAATIFANPGKTESFASAASRGFANQLGGGEGRAGGVAGSTEPEGDPDLAELDKNLKDSGSPDRNVRWSGASGLIGRRVGPRRDEVRKVAKALLAEPETEAHKIGLRILGRWGTEEDVPILSEHARDPDQGVRDHALHALAALKRLSCLPAILERFRTPEDRSMAVGAFKEFGTGAAATVVPLLDDPDDAVKLESARILEQVGHRGTIPALQAAWDRYKGAASAPMESGVFPDPKTQHARDMASTLENAVRNAANR